MRILKTTCLAALTALSLSVHAITVKHEQGELTLDKTPERIVVLELSFADALAQINVPPIGVADDNDHERIIARVREKIGDYISVGTRSQPNMETIASLKPDLIIADKSRHTAAYAELEKIAPVLVLNSRYGSFDDILEQAQTIGDVMGKSPAMQEKITALKNKLADIKAQIPPGQSAFAGNSREEDFKLHSNESYTGALLAHIGFVVPPAVDGNPLYDAGIEQVLALDPDWIFVAHYQSESIVRKWQKEPLWQALKAAKHNRVIEIEPTLWSRSRGLFAAEEMAEQALQIVREHGG